MSFGTRLKEKREALGITQPQLAKTLGVSQSAVGSWETDVNSPRATILYDLFEILHCDANYLLQDEIKELYKNEATPDEFENIIKKYRYIAKHSPNGAKTINAVLENEYSIAEQLEKQKDRIEELETSQATVIDIQPYQKNLTQHIYPYLGKIACAGTGFFFDDIPTDTIEVPYVKDADFVIGVNGDSMEPDYHDGEKLYLCKVESLQIGDTGIFTIGNECFLKELGEDGLISRNKDYDDILGNEDIRLVGKVIGKVEI